MSSWIIGLLIFLFGMILGWRQPRVWIWLVVLIIPAYLVKFTIGGIPVNLIELLIWGGSVGWLSCNPKVRFGWLWNRYQPIKWPIGLLLAGLAIGTIVSGDWQLSLGIVKGWFFTPILFYGVLTSVMGKVMIIEIVPLLLLSTLPISLVAIWQVVTGQFITIDHRASAWFASANYLSLYLVPIILLSAGLIWDGWFKFSKWFYWAIAVPAIVAIYFSFSYGGWLALVAGLLVIGFWQFRHRWQLWLGGGMLALLAGVSQLGTERVGRMLNLAEQSSASVRLQVWMTDLLMIKDRWLAGIGLGQYPTLYPEFIKRLFQSPLEPAMLHAHNLYFQFIINLGVLGFAGFVGVLVAFFRWLRNGDRLWSVPLLSAMIAVLVHGLVDTSYWKNDLALVFWIILGIALIRQNTSSKLTSLYP